MIVSRIRTVLGLAALLSLLSVSSSFAVPIALNNSFVTLEDFMSAGQFFTGLGGNIANPVGANSLATAGAWTWTSALPVQVDVTDWAIATDRFVLYLDDVAVGPGLHAPGLQGGTDYTSIGGGCSDPVSAPCHFTLDPGIAFNDPVFASDRFVFAPGSHTIKIQVSHVPTQQSSGPKCDLPGANCPPPGTPQNSATVAFRAIETVAVVPEPGTLILLGTGLLGASKTLRRRLRRARKA